MGNATPSGIPRGRREGSATTDQPSAPLAKPVADDGNVGAAPAVEQARRHGVHLESDARLLQSTLLADPGGGWRQPDAGLWGTLDDARHFTHPNLMALVAPDRAVRLHEELRSPPGRTPFPPGAEEAE